MRVHDWTKVSAGDFHDFHQAWTALLRIQLNDHVLPAGFYTQIEKVAGDIVPDVLTLHDSAFGGDDFTDTPPPGTLALATAPPRVSQVAEFERQAFLTRKNRLVIRHTSSQRIVAIIELVSSGNKANAREWRRFVDKAVAAFDHGIHLLIVDLYPPTRRDPQGVHAAIWSEIAGDEYTAPPGKPLTQVSYLAGERERAFIEPLAVGDELSSLMPLFLSDEVYVHVPLNESYAAAYPSTAPPVRQILDATLPSR
jgi:hypothetical protein